MVREITKGNVTKLEQLEEVMARMIVETLKRGFYGSARVEFAVQDGTIQYIRHAVEYYEK